MLAMKMLLVFGVYSLCKMKFLHTSAVSELTIACLQGEVGQLYSKTIASCLILLAHLCLAN